jgi:hypothetical protein
VENVREFDVENGRKHVDDSFTPVGRLDPWGVPPHLRQIFGRWSCYRCCERQNLESSLVNQ